MTEFVEHESLFEAEQEAARLAGEVGVAYVVVEARDEGDAPGVEAVFVVCPESAAEGVPRGREVVCRALPPAARLEAQRQAVRDALRFTNRALRIVDQRR